MNRTKIIQLQVEVPEIVIRRVETEVEKRKTLGHDTATVESVVAEIIEKYYSGKSR